jgi:4-carboxymuconolactone decarboxylase
MDIPDESRHALYERGLAVRKEVLGAEYVESSLRNASDFTAPFQDLVTEFCWGGIWGRPGLDRHTRSLLNLAMLTALGRSHEVEIHVRGALNNGVKKEEIVEVFLQAAIYCGMPAALDSFRVARKVIETHEAK